MEASAYRNVFGGRMGGGGGALVVYIYSGRFDTGVILLIGGLDIESVLSCRGTKLCARNM